MKKPQTLEELEIRKAMKIIFLLFLLLLPIALWFDFLSPKARMKHYCLDTVGWYGVENDGSITCSPTL